MSINTLKAKVIFVHIYCVFLDFKRSYAIDNLVNTKEKNLVRLTVPFLLTTLYNFPISLKSLLFSIYGFKKEKYPKSNFEVIRSGQVSISQYNVKLNWELLKEVMVRSENNL